MVTALAATSVNRGVRTSFTISLRFKAMTQFFPVLYRLMLLVLLSGCSETQLPVNSQGGRTSTPSPSSNSPAIANAETDSLFTFVKTKTESDGLRDTMELYALAGKFDLEAFRQFCKTKKSKANAKAFNYVVLFDNAINASFPNSPFTALYGIEEEKIKHIVAVFEYNRMNGFCEMRVYDPNMWEGKAKTEKL